MKPIPKKTIISYAIFIAIILSSYLISHFIRAKITNDTREKAIALSDVIKEDKYPDFNNFKSQKNLDLANNFLLQKPINVKNSSFKASYKINKNKPIVGAYLYLEASVNNKPLTTFDDFYLIVNGNGGHLIIENNKLPIPFDRISENVTAFLLPLNSITFKAGKDTKRSNYKTFDFLKSMNDTNILNIVADVNSQRGRREIVLIKIGYECSEGDDCLISKK